MIYFIVFTIEKTEINSLKTCIFNLLKLFKKMKKVVFISVCIVGILCFSSCRSTSKPCGLANDSTINTHVDLTEADLA